MVKVAQIVGTHPQEIYMLLIMPADGTVVIIPLLYFYFRNQKLFSKYDLKLPANIRLG